MQKLLVKLFIKNYKNTNDPIIRAKYGTLSGIVGIITNLLLCTFKIVFGSLCGSIAIVADGINNLTDASSSIITLIGFKLSTKPADEEHPFGHQRIEYLTGVIISFIILFVSIFLFIESIDKITNPSMQDTGPAAFIVLSASIIIKCWQAIFYKKMGKAIDSQTLAATSTDSLNDCISTGVVLICMLIYGLTPNHLNLDGYAGILVAIFIFVSGIRLLFETMNPLIGIPPSQEDIKKITTKVLSYEGVMGIHDLVMHNYGPNKTFATIHVEVDSAVDVMISHDLMDNIERDIKKELNIDLTVHMDPINVSDPETVELKQKVLNIVASLDPKLTIHDFRIVKGITHTNVLFDIVVPLKYKMTSNEIRSYLINNIKEIDEKYEVIVQVDQMYNRSE